MPPAITFQEILPDTLPAAWKANTTTALEITNALAEKYGYPIPWSIIRKVIQGAISGRKIELTSESESLWPCQFPVAKDVLLRVVVKKPSITAKPSAGQVISPTLTPESSIKILSAEDTLDVGEIQNLAKCISEIKRVTIDVKLHVTVRLEIQGKPDIPPVTVEKVARCYRCRGRRRGSGAISPPKPTFGQLGLS